MRSDSESQGAALAGVQSKRASKPAPFDPTRKWVRITNVRDDGFVEFEFALGEPEIFVEMILSAASFEEFCAKNQVVAIQKDRKPAAAEGWDWRMHDATHQRLK